MGGVENDVTRDHVLYNNKDGLKFKRNVSNLKIPKAVKAQLL